MSAIGVMRTPFPRYWLSAFLADFGDGVRLAAFPLLAVQVTDSLSAVAAVTALQGLPWILIGLGVGAVVDRWDLRKTMVGVDAFRTILIAALAVAVAVHAVDLPLIYLTAFVTGIGSMVRDTAATTALPRLIDRDKLERANGRLVAGGIIGNELAGPAIGGWLFGIAATLPFALNASSLGIAVLLLLSLPGVFSPLPRQSAPASGIRAAGGDIRQGLTWLRRDRSVRDLVIAVGVVAAADGAYLAVLVLYVTQILHRNSTAYGLLLAFGAVGGIIAGTSCALLTRWIGAQRLLVATVVVMAGAQLALGLTSDLAVSAIALLCSSGAFAIFNATSRSMRQRHTPPHLLGRVNSTYLTVGRSAGALGALAGGALAAAVDIQAPILAGSPCLRPQLSSSDPAVVPRTRSPPERRHRAETRTWNTLAADQGVSLRNLMAQMGHDNERAVLIYQHASKRADRLVAEGVEALLRAARKAADDDGDSDDQSLAGRKPAPK